ncbi:MAG TPA: hypothetical protein VME63_05390 [Dyella sp.]|uniref:hypothetical protein n=1 Tax=Dyella sp. TaxID=1869338 RepID=UPI002C6E56DA|nr:hypothetical protein [Dyella sp.]HTV84815.1 hypothetical protein [Dyella sp.]
MADLLIYVNGGEAGKVYEATVGERLTFSVRCSEGAVLNPSWHISGGSACGDFQMAKNASVETLATMGHSATASWCVACTGQARVTVRAQVDGKTLDAELRLNISAPKVLTFSAETDDIHIDLVDSDFHVNGALYLTFGGLKAKRKPGIAWTAKLLGAPAKAGRYAFVQLMKIDRQKSYQGQVLKDWGGTSGGEWVLDEDVFYGTTEGTDPALGQAEGDAEDYVVTEWPRESTLIKGEDSPGTPLFTVMPEGARFRFDEVKIKEQFQTHLMFRPNMPDDSIWVSIARLDWYWEAHAKFKDGAWELLSADFEVDPVAEKGYDFPRWSNNRDKILKV